MSGLGGLPERLRHEVERDARPVRPLPPAWLRLGWMLLWGLCIGLVVPALQGMRPDGDVLGPFLAWGATLTQGAAALWLVFLALREAVPGRGLPRGVRLASLLGGGALQMAVGVATWTRLGMPEPGSAPVAKGVTCMTMESAIGLPAVLLTALLVARAWAVRPRWAGVLGGAGAGLLADAVQHLICPVSDLQHVLIWHGGAVLLLSLAGWLAGVLVERRRARGERSAIP